MADTVAGARELIRDRLRAIADERKKLEQALKHLAPTRQSRSRARRTRKSPARDGGRRPSEARLPSRPTVAPAGERRRQLIAHLERHPGAKPAQIAKAIETSPANLHKALRKAVAEDAVSKGENGGYTVTKDKPPRARKKADT